MVQEQFAKPKPKPKKIETPSGQFNTSNSNPFYKSNKPGDGRVTTDFSNPTAKPKAVKPSNIG